MPWVKSTIKPVQELAPESHFSTAARTAPGPVRNLVSEGAGGVCQITW
jgi:hypothetical protein